MNARLNRAPLFCLLTLACLFLYGSAVWPQASDTMRTITIPLLHEDLSLYDYAFARQETGTSSNPPEDIVRRTFQPVQNIFKKDSLYYLFNKDSSWSFWIKFSIANNTGSDTTIALVFPAAVSKAVLYKAEGDRLIQSGKTGFFFSVLARNVSYRDNRIDLMLNAHTTTNYFIHVILYYGNWMPKMPVLENYTYAEARAFEFEKGVHRLTLMWFHFFTGIFFMFFVFGLIKYLVFDRDKSYLYYSLMGLFNALLTVSMAEYPPLELPGFENIRSVELFDVMAYAALIMQVWFILEILQLKTKYPRITRAIKWYFIAGLALTATRTTLFFTSRGWIVFLDRLDLANGFLLLFFFIVWVVYLSRIRKGFYRFIFLGALTVSTTFIFIFIIRFFELQYLLPPWFGDDGRGRPQHLMQFALVVDMLFYFTGLAYRDRQVEKDKVLFQEQLKIQKLESEKTKVELQHQASELEMQALRAQMNPHFIFNCLNAINHFILNNEPDTASGYLTKFSRLVRLILQNSQLALISLESELEALQLYLQLEVLRFNHHFDYTIKTNEDLDIAVLKVPPLIIQPYTENAIWHGLMHKQEKGHIDIEIVQEDDMLLFKITDNGIGRKKAAGLKSKTVSGHKSMGMQITADRIAMLQQEKQPGGGVTVNDIILPDGSAGGTAITILIPALYD